MNFFISLDKQILISLDLHIWADALPSCVVFDTRNPREMDYGKNKNLYYCCKSNQKKNTERCIRWPWFPLERTENTDPDVFRSFSYPLCHSAVRPQHLSCGTALSCSLFWKQCVMNSWGIIGHVRTLRLLSAADCLLPLQQLEELLWKKEATIAFH